MNTNNTMPANTQVDLAAVMARLAQLEASNAELLILKTEADERARMISAGAVQTTDGWVGKDRKRIDDSIRLSGFTEGISNRGKSQHMDVFPGAIHVGARGMSGDSVMEFTTYYADAMLRLMKAGKLESVLLEASEQHKAMLVRKAELKAAGIAGRS